MLDKELSAIKQELERKEFDNTKLREKINGLELKISKHDRALEDKEKEIEELAEEIDRLKEEKG